MSNKQQKIEYVTLNRRLIALSIDICFITLILLPIYFLFSWIAQKLGANSESSIWAIIIVNLISISCSCTYFLYSWIKMSASPGKYIMRCKIVDKENFENISPKQAFLRLLGLIITFGLGIFLADFNKKRQGIHDKISSTVVIKR